MVTLVSSLKTDFLSTADNLDHCKGIRTEFVVPLGAPTDWLKNVTSCTSEERGGAI